MSSKRCKTWGQRAGMTCRWAVFLVVFVLASSGLWLSAQVKVGDEPELSLSGLKGERVTLLSLQGKVVLLDFWATWCAPCRESMPFYRELYEEKNKEGFEILAISVDEELASVEEFKKRYRLPFLVLLDAEHVAAAHFGPPTMPTAYLVDKGGRIQARFEGFRTSDKAKIRQAVEELLAEPAAEAENKRDEEEGER